MHRNRWLILLLVVLMSAICCRAPGETYRYPPEETKHEGTWLIWPHDYGKLYNYYKEPYEGASYRSCTESVWVAMAKALHTGETVHIIAYDELEKAHIQALLEAEQADMRKIDFFIRPTDDVWAQDSGPIFVQDEQGRMVIANFTFDGWGKKQKHELDQGVAQAIADAYGHRIVQISELALEGGSIEGVIGEDITDAHIDGIARFINDQAILVCSREEYRTLFQHDPDEHDYAVISNAKNARGEPYELVILPLTKTKSSPMASRSTFMAAISIIP